jgi:hypothetical protein
MLISSILNLNKVDAIMAQEGFTRELASILVQISKAIAKNV